ncbi:AraC family transcriptional regulator [Sinimarinibacterium sp. NLF-5-8]|uniref:AraC family transcriptional regulator n=1 Tax=Sinimarinibacterium sp. NLF-5-8 TaxID=2698684 RepID=UPI00137BCDB7|nr:AraC family transcriptional regulator [Sinimarinibacterium sp. NLF-5-8]QHS10366.1 AraC family transcriptional regulator [Sinimarinibacterium sp. NLF-5-8]
MTDLIRASVLAGFDDLVCRLGGDPQSLLRRFHLHDVQVDSVNALVPYVNVVRIIEAAAQALSAPDFGLQLAHYQTLDRLGPVALLISNCQTAGSALQVLASNIHTYSPNTTLRLVQVQADLTWLEYDVTHAQLSAQQRLQKSEFSLLFALRVLRMLIGARFEPRGVMFRHTANKPLGVYISHFGVSPQFDAEINAVALDPRDLAQPLEMVAPTIRRAIDEYLQPMIDRQPLALDRQVLELMSRLLPAGRCRLSSIADHLGMNERTLQRQLAEAGLVFETMVDDLRRTRALELLGNAQISLAHVGGMLGYSEQSTFTRACKRWFARTPGQQRKHLISTAPPTGFPSLLRAPTGLRP